MNDPILYISILLALGAILTLITFFENDDDDNDGEGELSNNYKELIFINN
tara:strand:+ start:292 stop:441 length:150 start_codon:yes stop_codon:yes gene_type:complete